MVQYGELDLNEPRPLRFITYDAAGQPIREHVVAGDEMMAPAQLAHAALHADGVSKVRVLDAVTGVLLLEQGA